MMFCIPCALSGGLNHPAVNAVKEVPTKVDIYILYIYKPEKMARSVEEQSGVEEGQ